MIETLASKTVSDHNQTISLFHIIDAVVKYKQTTFDYGKILLTYYEISIFL